MKGKISKIQHCRDQRDKCKAACELALNAILLLQPAPKTGIVFAAVKELQRAISYCDKEVQS